MPTSWLHCSVLCLRRSNAQAPSLATITARGRSKKGHARRWRTSRAGLVSTRADARRARARNRLPACSLTVGRKARTAIARWQQAQVERSQRLCACVRCARATGRAGGAGTRAQRRVQAGVRAVRARGAEGTDGGATKRVGAGGAECAGGAARRCSECACGAGLAAWAGARGPIPGAVRAADLQGAVARGAGRTRERVLGCACYRRGGSNDCVGGSRGGGGEGACR